MSRNIGSPRIIILALLASLTVGNTLATAADADLKADLELVASRRILFGHQSVGANVIDGIKQLAQTEGVPIRIVEVQTASQVGPATFGHVYVAENGKPAKKFESFEFAMDRESSDPDIVFLKLCYVDFSAETDATTLFAKYRATVDRLKVKHPNTTLVHVTAPLTVVQTGAKALVKRLLGRTPSGIMENIRRNEYNELIRKTYSGREPVFDLAHVESMGPNGQAVTVEWEQMAIPVLAQQYTDDGGHLNDTGKFRAARELISVLVTIPKKSTTVKSTQ
jgi:hypothetical protein